ncbi:isocitrate lyase/phosphoenolpyruvate mutase family protein [Streptomyces sp. 8N114]|uniref:isocitrate lyase/phosphoenolpyruvate mutase family protein n=1 Tax=Streptomyces sp. 8N114 TaxID=3457419 RepID=UPI003FD35E81
MSRTVHELDRSEDVRAALANPHLVPELPPAAEARGPLPERRESSGEGASMAWLRATVPRFSSGETHARRRALVEAELRRVDPAELRRAVASRPGAAEADVRIRVVAALAEALGLREPDAVAEAVTVVAGTYFGGTDPAADAAVAELVGLVLGKEGAGEEDEMEVAAGRICLLVQACDATAALVRHATAAGGVTAGTAVGSAEAARAGAVGASATGAAGGAGEAAGADAVVGADTAGAGAAVGVDTAGGAGAAPGAVAAGGAGAAPRTAVAAGADAAASAGAGPGAVAAASARDTAASARDTAVGADGGGLRVGGPLVEEVVKEVLGETLRRDPPVRVLRRVAVRDTRVGGQEIAEGEVVVLDIARAGRGEARGSLAFGAPPRECPGREHALALAAGLLAPGPRTPFARLHHRDTPLLLPNAWDYVSAAALVADGFEAVGTTSLGVAAAAGLPDGVAATAEATLALARQLGGGRFLFTVDAEGGFSDGPAQVAELARQLRAAGAAGLNIEDGRGDGTLAPAELHAAKIAAVKAAVPELFVNARTDTHWLGCRQDETEARLVAYQRAGADGVFVPGLSDRTRIGALTARLDVPLNILYTPDGPGLAELAALGVRRVSLGSLLYRTALGAAVAAARAVREGRHPAGGDSTPSYAEVQMLSSGAGQDRRSNRRSDRPSG